jgi:hypothetical protein
MRRSSGRLRSNSTTGGQRRGWGAIRLAPLRSAPRGRDFLLLAASRWARTRPRRLSQVAITEMVKYPLAEKGQGVENLHFVQDDRK